MLDRSEIYIKELSHSIINLYKLCIEDMGYDMGDTNNEIEYRNYLVDSPIMFYNENKSSYSDDNTYVDNGEGMTFGDGTEIFNDVIIPQSVLRNQKLGKCPQSFIDGVTKASKVTGIPVKFYIAFGALESGWKDYHGANSYGGYFGQKANEGGRGSVYEQAQGMIVNIYRQAIKDAKTYGFTNQADILAWCYLCHNAGNAGAKTMLNALGGRLRQKDINMYKKAAIAFVNAYGKRWGSSTQNSQVNEKTLSIPKAYYVASQIYNS